MSYDADPLPRRKRLTPEERERVLRKVDALHDATLFRPDLEDVARLAERARNQAATGFLEPDVVPALKAAFDRFGIT